MPNAPLTESQRDQVADLREAGLTYDAIAAKLGVNSWQVQWVCMRLAIDPPGVAPPRPIFVGQSRRGDVVVRYFTPAEDKLLHKLSLSGLPTAEIARRMGRARTSVIARMAILARWEERAEASIPDLMPIVSLPEPTRTADILKFVAARHCVTLDDIRGPLRTKKLVAARRDAIQRFRAAGLSLPNIARRMNRDHTTVLHHLQRSASIRENNTRQDLKQVAQSNQFSRIEAAVAAFTGHIVVP